MEIRPGAFLTLLRSQHTFPFQARVFETEQQRELQVGNVWITDHLGDMRFGKARNYLRISSDYPRYPCHQWLDLNLTALTRKI